MEENLFEVTRERNGMKDVWQYLLIGFVVVAVEGVFLALFAKFFNGLTPTEALIIGAAFFLAFEIIICTGVIISKFNSSKDE